MSWRLIQTPPGDAAWNMAVDEALWNDAAPETPPTICLHDFDCESVTLGFAQSHADLVGTGLEHLPWTRRLTGGGAIHHHERCVTFSITGQGLSTGTKRPGPIARAMGDLLVAIWHRLGVETQILTAGDPSTHTAPLCADRLHPGDVVRGVTKVAGLGQRLRRGRLLVQCAILLDRVGIETVTIESPLQSALRERLGWEIKPCGLTARERGLAEQRLVRRESLSAARRSRIETVSTR
jgi:lipoate-protein ligase A